MDWEAKQWKWENMAILNSKEILIPKPAKWGIELEEGVDNGSLYSSGDGGYVVGEGSGSGSGSGFPGSEGGHVFSSRSSKSTSADSSSLERTSEFCFEEYEGLHELVNNKEKLGNANQFGNSLILKASEKFGEPLIGLKLGKRTYFKDILTGSNGKASSIPVNPMPSAPTPKRHRSSSQSVTLCCIVEGCNLDISSAKEYHRKHKICECHSKSSVVIVNGMERRFCQQCSRLHGLTEFDGKKRSCRKRLSNHNARRRKPQREIIQFNSSRIGSLLYDGRQRMELSKIPFLHGNAVANFTLEDTCNSKFTLTQEYPSKPAKTRGNGGQMHLPNSGLPNAINITYHESKGYLPLKGDTAQVLNQDGRQRMELNKIPFLHGNAVMNFTLEDTYNSNFSLTQEYPSKPAKTRGNGGQMHFPNSGPPNAINITYHESKGYLPLKGDTAQVLNQDIEGSMISKNMIEAQNLRCVLSLLSKGSYEPQAALFNHRMAATSTSLPESQMSIVCNGRQLMASENWLYEQSSELQAHALTGQNDGYSHVPKFQLFQMPYGSGS